MKAKKGQENDKPLIIKLFILIMQEIYCISFNFVPLKLLLPQLE